MKNVFVGILIVIVGFLLGYPFGIFGIVIIVAGIILIFGGSSNKKTKTSNTKTSTYQKKEEVNHYKCDQCKGDGYLDACSICEGELSWEAEDRDDFNLYCALCRKHNIDHDVKRIACDFCNGTGYNYF